MRRAVRIPWLALALAGCGFETPPADPPAPSAIVFENEVYPILLRDCGFPDCHGSSERFFRVFGPNRARLDDAVTALDDPATPEEIAASYERARSMLSGVTRPEETLLLRKPLEVDVGGAPHMGIDQHGQDVYPSPDHPSFRIMQEWVALGFPGAP
ncbi:MAG: hypothetical protein VYE22_12565 [Myxococcota bacterium]|nr:hypothetical protein [Myxococcota bacterium]